MHHLKVSKILTIPFLTVILLLSCSPTEKDLNMKNIHKLDLLILLLLKKILHYLFKTFNSALIVSLPQHDLETAEQLPALHHVLQNHYPPIAERAQQSRLNILHQLIYFPGDIYAEMSNLINKFPEVLLAVDFEVKTPLHHAITSIPDNICIQHVMIIYFSAHQIR